MPILPGLIIKEHMERAYDNAGHYVTDVDEDIPEPDFDDEELNDIITKARGDLLTNLEVEIKDGVAKGLSPDEIASNLEKYREFAGSRAKVIAATESVNAHSRGIQDTLENKGVKYKQWYTSMSERTCPICAVLNGQIVPINKKFTVWYKGKKYSFRYPTAHPFCECGIFEAEEPEELSEDIRYKELVKLGLTDTSHLELQREIEMFGLPDRYRELIREMNITPNLEKGFGQPRAFREKKEYWELKEILRDILDYQIEQINRKEHNELQPLITEYCTQEVGYTIHQINAFATNDEEARKAIKNELERDYLLDYRNLFEFDNFERFEAISNVGFDTDADMERERESILQHVFDLVEPDEIRGLERIYFNQGSQSINQDSEFGNPAINEFNEEYFKQRYEEDKIGSITGRYEAGDERNEKFPTDIDGVGARIICLSTAKGEKSPLHEIGHHVMHYRMPDYVFRQFGERVYPLEQVSDYARTDSKEGFAEAFALYKLSPVTMKAEYPKTYNFFEYRYLTKNEPIKYYSTFEDTETRLMELQQLGLIEPEEVHFYGTSESACKAVITRGDKPGEKCAGITSKDILSKEEAMKLSVKELSAKMIQRRKLIGNAAYTKRYGEHYTETLDEKMYPGYQKKTIKGINPSFDRENKVFIEVKGTVNDYTPMQPGQVGRQWKHMDETGKHNMVFHLYHIKSDGIDIYEIPPSKEYRDRTLDMTSPYMVKKDDGKLIAKIDKKGVFMKYGEEGWKYAEVGGI